MIGGHSAFIGISVKTVAKRTFEPYFLVINKPLLPTKPSPDNLAKAFDSLKEYDGVLVLSDLPGGSPFKTAVELKFERPDQVIEVISGTNLPLLVASATMTSVFDNPLDLAEAMIPEGKDSIVRFELAVSNNEPEDDEDGI